MCRGCWIDAGSPTDRSVHEPELLVLIAALYDDHATGGPLHHVLDDENLDDGSLTGYYREQDYSEENNACLRYVCDRILELLRQMTLRERQAVTARHFGYLKDETQGDT